MRLLPRLAAWGAQRLSTGRSIAAKPLIGFSDITALHLWLQSSGIASIHAPVLTQLGRLPAENPRRLFSLLESGTPASPLVGTDTYVEGTVEGPLLGGNLSVFTRLLGTPFMPSLDGAVLLLEDLSEQPYRSTGCGCIWSWRGCFARFGELSWGSFWGVSRGTGGIRRRRFCATLRSLLGFPVRLGFPLGMGM